MTSTSKLIRRARDGVALNAHTTTDEDIDQLRAALQGALGTARTDEIPSVDEAALTTWRAAWPGLAELGLTGFCVPEAQGGFGLEVPAAVAAANELGTALHPSPYAGTTAAAHALAADPDGPTGELLARVLSGEVVCGFGALGPDGRTARDVDGGPDLDALVLVDASGLAVVVDDPGTWDATPVVPRFDVTRIAADVVVDPARARRIGDGGVAVLLHRLLLAADALGGVQRMLDRTVAYAGERIAFGRPIGGFQAVQHRLVDHALRLRGMGLLVDDAARRLAASDPGAERAVALASLSATGSSTRVLHDLLQLTGGIGFTWEYGLHLYERRAHQDARLAGGPRGAARALASLEGWS